MIHPARTIDQRGGRLAAGRATEDNPRSVQPRYIRRVALFLALTVAGSIIARVLVERDLRRESDRRAQVAAAQIHSRVTQAASLTESLRRYMLDVRSSGVTSDQFAQNALRWLGPARFSAAAWLERVPQSRRAAYERRIGQAIVMPDTRHGMTPVGRRAAYLPATLITGFPPMAVPGIDLRSAPGVAAAADRATLLSGVVATPMASPGAGRGFFLVAPAPNLIEGQLRPGYVAVFVSELGLRDAARGVPALQISSGGTAPGGNTSATSFSAAGQSFTVVVPREKLQDAAAILPWLILVGGLLVVGLGTALGLNAARRVRAQEDLDRIFTLSQDLIAVADLDGRFTRVNPAAEEILGHTAEELLTRPYIELVHPADRDRTAAETDAVAEGRPSVSFENRYVRKDGSVRVLDWRATPDVEHGLVYAVARDVTERRDAEAQAQRLADEQAALRRVATMVARGRPAEEVFGTVAEEVGRLLGLEFAAVRRFEPDGSGTIVGRWGEASDAYQLGARMKQEGESITTVVYRTGRSARFDDYAESGSIPDDARRLGLRAAVASPIIVDGRIWGAIASGTSREEPMPEDAESRIANFTELVAAAISNVQARSDLAASRARIVAAADEERRRVVRDLHDGAQQRFVHTVVTLTLAQQALQASDEQAAALVGEALEQAKQGNTELRELAHGILPSSLTHGGLRSAIAAVLKRLHLPVELDIPSERFPPEIEASAYFIVAEALTNVVKHAHADHADVRAAVEDGSLRIEVRDDGVGGADPEGHGLVGIADRVTALGGRLEIDSPRDGGTRVVATLPLSAG
jgi:PAS domain S-box-containing protein